MSGCVDPQNKIHLERCGCSWCKSGRPGGVNAIRRESEHQVCATCRFNQPRGEYRIQSCVRKGSPVTKLLRSFVDTWGCSLWKGLKEKGGEMTVTSTEQEAKYYEFRAAKDRLEAADLMLKHAETEIYEARAELERREGQLSEALGEAAVIIGDVVVISRGNGRVLERKIA
jgi:hypothetical protein